PRIVAAQADQAGNVPTNRVDPADRPHYCQSVVVAGGRVVNLLKYLTNIEGSTVGDIVASTGLPVAQVRAALVALEKEGKAVRERGKIGFPHLWWRVERKPLGDEDVVLCMGLAAAFHPTPGKLRSV